MSQICEDNQGIADEHERRNWCHYKVGLITYQARSNHKTVMDGIEVGYVTDLWPHHLLAKLAERKMQRITTCALFQRYKYDITAGCYLLRHRIPLHTSKCILNSS